VASAERPTSNIRMQLSSRLGVQRSALDVEHLYSGNPAACSAKAWQNQ
jgi:hypothetical protein